MTEEIEKMPEIEQEVKEKRKSTRAKEYNVTGQWIVDEAKAVKKCSACDAEMHGWAYRQEFKYCPMCGVKME